MSTGCEDSTPPKRRKSLSVRTRFEVFKRDRFSCTYCGKTPPNVLLHVDHIVPVAAGGGNDMSNLLTACAECNGGKGARLLEDGAAPGISAAATAEMRERVKQAKAYAKACRDMQALEDEQRDELLQRWIENFDGKLEGGRYHCSTYFPYDRNIRLALRSVGLSRALDAVDIAFGRIGKRGGADAAKYFTGVCRRMLNPEASQ